MTDYQSQHQGSLDEVSPIFPQSNAAGAKKNDMQRCHKLFKLLTCVTLEQHLDSLSDISACCYQLRCSSSDWNSERVKIFKSWYYHTGENKLKPVQVML